MVAVTAPESHSTSPREPANDRLCETHAAIDAVWRMESAKVIAGLARIVRDVGVAEELAQDALVAALEQWPRSGVPDNPGAWLMEPTSRGRRGPARLPETIT
jgi:DNA-directed RNA polymerase specialized sigma24 family protein